MTSSPIIVWFRRDLRLEDNPALDVAVQSGKPIICLYIDETDRARPLGAASRWWLHHSLDNLHDKLTAIGGSLTLRRGEPSGVLEELIDQTGADHIVWNRRYEEDARTRDGDIKSSLIERGLTVQSFKANLLTEPWERQTKTGGYYKVFTPYWRAVRSELTVMPPLPAPTQLSTYKGEVESLALEGLALLPHSPNWGAKMKAHWQIGPEGAKAALAKFLESGLETYTDDRNRPDRPSGTSHLSPHLAFGEISPRQIWHACRDKGGLADKFLSEIGWREFSYVLLYHNPKLGSENFKPYFDSFDWDDNPSALERWQQGQTGYPFVDAGMRQLWATGWQHNRVRMVTASFLIKHLLIDWRRGEQWFYDTLVDADPASNAASWQWVAGSGADASPYFRIFNPFTQGEKFDPNCEYVRRWVPELARLPKKYIHRPWEAPPNVLAQANVKLGEDYPHPIVDHKFARERALSAYKDTRHPS
ncbi:MAG: deoxyribodipyrimidine photo-lyase [Maricaulaceae bacterium]